MDTFGNLIYMRIVHISSTDIKGGAGLAAFRLHRGLLDHNISSRMLVRHKYSTDPFVQEVRPKKPAQKDQTDLAWGQAIQHYLREKQIEKNGLPFSVCTAGFDLTQTPAIQTADLIHLHWVADFQSSVTVAKLLESGKPVVWTLHDQRPLSGGCHCTWGCDHFIGDCADCPQLLPDALSLPKAVNHDQRQLYGNNRLHVITPSRWMAQQVKKSAVLRTADCHTIPNAVDTRLFFPVDRDQTRKRLELHPTDLIFVHGSENLSNTIKGGHLLPEIFEQCLANRNFSRMVRDGRVVLLLFGRHSPQIERIPIPVRYMGEIADAAKMRAIYSASDYLVLPSLQDNLPNTMIEAMACGTPVIAFRTGGIGEFVQHGKTGFLSPVGDLSLISEHIRTVMVSAKRWMKWREACRKKILECAGPKVQTRAVLSLYKQMCAGRPPVPAKGGGCGHNHVSVELISHLEPNTSAICRMTEQAGNDCPDGTEMSFLRQLAIPRMEARSYDRWTIDQTAALFTGWVESGLYFQRLTLDEWAKNFWIAARAIFEALPCRQALRSETLAQFAILCRELGAAELALMAAEKALESKPTSISARYQQAVTQRALCHWDQALAGFENLSTTGGHSGDLWFQRAVTLHGMQKSRLALEAIDNALEFNSHHAWLLERGFILRDLQRFDEAVEMFDAVIVIQGDHFAAHQAKGASLALSGNCGAAVEHFEMMLDLFPDHTELILNISDAYRYARRYEEALAVLVPLKEKGRDAKGVNRKIAQVHEAKEEFIQALTYYQAEHRLYPEEALARRIERLSKATWCDETKNHDASFNQA